MGNRNSSSVQLEGIVTGNHDDAMEKRNLERLLRLQRVASRHPERAFHQPGAIELVLDTANSSTWNETKLVAYQVASVFAEHGLKDEKFETQKLVTMYLAGIVLKASNSQPAILTERFRTVSLYAIQRLCKSDTVKVYESRGFVSFLIQAGKDPQLSKFALGCLGKLLNNDEVNERIAREHASEVSDMLLGLPFDDLVATCVFRLASTGQGAIALMPKRRDFAKALKLGMLCDDAGVKTLSTMTIGIFMEPNDLERIEFDLKTFSTIVNILLNVLSNPSGTLWKLYQPLVALKHLSRIESLQPVLRRCLSPSSTQPFLPLWLAVDKAVAVDSARSVELAILTLQVFLPPNGSLTDITGEASTYYFGVIYKVLAKRRIPGWDGAISAIDQLFQQDKEKLYFRCGTCKIFLSAPVEVEKICCPHCHAVLQMPRTYRASSLEEFSKATPSTQVVREMRSDDGFSESEDSLFDADSASIRSTMFTGPSEPRPRQADGMLVHELPPLESNLSYYFFASHNWGRGEENHRRVGNLVNAFKNVGKAVWFDDERVTGHIELQICEGIDHSAVFVAFITKDYVEKVKEGAKHHQTDWCYVEFNYAATRKPNKLIAVVMEEAMLNQSNWIGPVGSRLGTVLFVDYTSEEKLDSAVKQLAKQIANKM